MYFSILGHFEVILIVDKTDYVVQFVLNFKGKYIQVLQVIRILINIIIGGANRSH